MRFSRFSMMVLGDGGRSVRSRLRRSVIGWQTSDHSAPFGFITKVISQEAQGGITADVGQVSFIATLKTHRSLERRRSLKVIHFLFYSLRARHFIVNSAFHSPKSSITFT